MTKTKNVSLLFETAIWRNAHRGVLTALLDQHGHLPVTLVCEPSNEFDGEAIAILSDLDASVVGGDACGDMRRIGYISMTKTFGDHIRNPRKSELFKHIETLGGKTDATLVFVLTRSIGCEVSLMMDVEVAEDEFDDDIHF